MRVVPAAALAAWISLGAPAEARAPEAAVHDLGIFSDLDATVRIALPARIDPAETRLRLDDARGAVVLYEGSFPLKIYPLTAPCPAGALAPLALLEHLAPADVAELRALVSTRTIVERAPPATAAVPGDSDGDGIPDPLDILMGARKLVVNRAAYTEGYTQLAYPNGDVPRDIGVCTDTVIRAYRNAGIDLQRKVAEDIRGARAAYPAVTRPNASIDHRRVKTLVTWFLRHVPQVREGPNRPGDVVFLDTFPGRPGPDHVGIVSDRIAPSGLPFVINNWTVGFREGEMDLLSWVPVTHRFRMK